MRAVTGIFAVVIIVAAVPIMLQATFVDSTSITTVVNETFQPTTSGVTELNESFRDDVLYNETVTVYNNSGVLATEPDDYEWFANNGTIRANATGNLATDPSANITYSFRDSTDKQLVLLSLYNEIPKVIGTALPLLVVLLFILVFLGGL